MNKYKLLKLKYYRYILIECKKHMLSDILTKKTNNRFQTVITLKPKVKVLSLYK